MDFTFNPKAHYEATKRSAGYIARKQSTQETYDRIGFMSGLEVHQQLLTKEKLFCHCPAGQYNKSHVYDAELIRHMRPTLSELGEYDGTALMEFKTRKEIIYRLKNETACTYEVDDTPPFPVNREAIEIAIEISLLSKLNIVGEVHITRKQYLDGSIPTGFQRTAIIGVEGEIELRNKKIRLIQLSIEEDSCREISDIGHTRIYKTDRLGMPLIETVTYPDCVNPDEVKEACDYIRFLNRSTGKVRTGIGSGRQDVNVSCRGGSRVEIKGVARTRWIPELTHNEAFRQWSLLLLRDDLKNSGLIPATWKIQSFEIKPDHNQLMYPPLAQALAQGHLLILVRLPFCKGALSHFTQPGKMFANEISDRLKVIACLEKPNMLHSEMLEPVLNQEDWKYLQKIASSTADDALVLVWGPSDDMPTAIETIEERLKMAMEGIPNETRKSLPDGTTLFERVLPGADRMYPDTDSAPIPLEDKDINEIRGRIPQDTVERFRQMREWGVPEDTYTYILSKNLFPILEEIILYHHIPAVFAGTLIGHRLKNLLGKMPTSRFKVKKIIHLFAYLNDQKLHHQLAWAILPLLVEHPRIDFDSALTLLKFKKIESDEILAKLPYVSGKFVTKAGKEESKHRHNWIMGQMRKIALGNIDLTLLANQIKTEA